MVPFFDLKRQYQSIKDEVGTAIQNVLNDTAFSGGKYTEEFEKNLASFVGVKHAIGLNSGTSALHLALLAHNIGPGDEVIIPANTFIATVWAASYVGATPIFIDCDPNTWNIDVHAIESKITSKTKMIMAVDLYGQPANWDALEKIAQKHNIILLEDGAQSIGASYNGKNAMTFGQIAATSFYPGKNLGAYGEGGAIFTNDDAIAEKIHKLKAHGSSVRYYHEMIGYNMRMDGFQGAVLNVKLRHIANWNKRRQEIAAMYKAKINNDAIKFQASEANATSVYHLMVITTENKELFINHLQKMNVGFAFHYPVPCHLQQAYAHLGYKQGDFPNSEYLASHCVSLPMFPEMTNEEVDEVINAVNTYSATATA